LELKKHIENQKAVKEKVKELRSNPRELEAKIVDLIRQKKVETSSSESEEIASIGDVPSFESSQSSQKSDS